MNSKFEFLFPTNILITDNVLESEYLDSMVSDTLQKGKTGRQINWQSHPRLQDELKYKSLSEAALNLGKKYAENLKWKYEHIFITDMWSNILKPGETHAPHTHSNNIISGVFYLKANDTAGLRFYDPRPQSTVFDLNREFNWNNCSLWEYASKTNRMILFPSWLSHMVPPNITKDNRISVAFNLMVKGKVGTPDEFQSSEF
jgi:uncharacterized protein (TIGR02466 family)